MDEQQIITLLAQCKPLATKLAVQGYEYTLDPTDLAYLPVLEQIRDELLHDYLHPTKDGMPSDGLIAQSGLTPIETHWLIVNISPRQNV